MTIKPYALTSLVFSVVLLLATVPNASAQTRPRRATQPRPERQTEPITRPRRVKPQEPPLPFQPFLDRLNKLIDKCKLSPLFPEKP
jgi:hypothetical protein